MIYSIIQPPDSLKDVVSFFWVSEVTGTEEDIYTYYSTAETFSKLVFLYKTFPGHFDVHKEFSYAALQGQTQGFDQIPTKGSFEIFGVHLFPYAIPYLLGIPCSEITDQMVDLLIFMGPEGRILNEKMAEANHTRQRISIVSEFFNHSLSRNHLKETAMVDAIKQVRALKGNVHIPTLADRYCFSQKQFERKFKEWSGFHPKLFARIVRFETALGCYSKFSSLTEVAYSCGYYDQSHFIHDFKKFTGHPPRNFFSLVQY